jgi:hypothetical protein
MAEAQLKDDQVILVMSVEEASSLVACIGFTADQGQAEDSDYRIGNLLNTVLPADQRHPLPGL